MADGARPMSFERWKQVQINEAQNQVVRISNRVRILRSDGFKLEEAKRGPAPVESSNESGGVKVDEVSNEKLETAEAEIKRSLENLQYSKGLQFSDYIQVYVKQFSKDNKGLKKIARSLTPSQVAELLSANIQESTTLAAEQPEAVAKVEEKSDPADEIKATAL